MMLARRRRYLYGVSWTGLLLCACFHEAPAAASEDATSSSATTTVAPQESSGEPRELQTTSSDSADSSSEADDGSSSGVRGPLCGDGIVEGDELCDDENDAPGDGCTLCQVSGTPLWIFTDGTDAPGEAANAVALASRGNGIVVVGALAIDGADTDIWLEVFDEDGGSMLRRTVAGEGDADDAAFDVRVRPSGDITVVGEISAPASFTDLWVGRYDGDASLIDQSQAGSTIGADGARAVALLGADQVVVAGRIGFAAANDNAWLGRFVGGELSDSASCDCGAQGHAASVAADAQGRVRATWQSGLDWQLVGFDEPIGVAQPLPSWTAPLEGLLGPAFIDVGPDGGLSLCGTVAAGNDDALSLQTFSADGTPQLSVTYDVGDGDQHCAGILVLGNTATMVGEIRDDSDDARGLLVAVERSNGVMRYSTELTIGNADETVIDDIVVDAAGAVFVVGAFSNGGGDFDPFVARLVP
jgi:cysteine-rich repeat protein